MKDLNLFIENMLKKAGFNNKDEINLLSADIKPVLMDRIISKIGVELNQEQLSNVTQMINSGKDIEEVVNYIKSIIPDYENYIDKICEEFEQGYLKNFK